MTSYYHCSLRLHWEAGEMTDGDWKGEGEGEEEGKVSSRGWLGCCGWRVDSD